MARSKGPRLVGRSASVRSRWRRPSALPLTLLLVVGVLAACETPDPDADSVAVRINAGGAALSHPEPAYSFEADTAAAPHPTLVGGSNSTIVSANVVDTDVSTVPPSVPMSLFQHSRFDAAGGTPMTYRIPVPEGVYAVRLYFAETWGGAFSVGARVFDVFVEEELAHDDLDIFAKVGANTAMATSSFHHVTDGEIEVRFEHVVQNPTINGIEVFRLSDLTEPVGPALSVSPGALSFAPTAVGSMSQQQVVLRNTAVAGGQPLTITGATVTGAGAGAFVLPQSVVGTVLQPGASVATTVRFQPVSVGVVNASVSFTHTGTNSPLVVTVSGTGSGSGGPSTPSFSKSTLTGANFFLPSRPTSIQWGPDGRLYVAQYNGTISILTVSRFAKDDYRVTAQENITSVRNTPNHDDMGNPDPVVNRLVTGMTVTGTAANPVIHTVSADPRIGGGPAVGDQNLDTNSGILHRLTWTGSTWQKVDLIRGLPRSEESHMTSGMALDESTNTLYLAQGGNTNHGAPSHNFAFLPETALTAAILTVDLDAIGSTTYDLPTLDDEDRPGVVDANDPFGGNNGKNQARLVPGSPVQIYAPGFRNVYDIVRATTGFYAIDNGGNAGWGGVPAGEGPGGTCTNAVDNTGPNLGDTLHRITGPGYYAGHPNPTRANMANEFNASNPQSPVSVANPIECDWRDNPDKGALATFPTSTNGIDEITTGNFGGAMVGDLLAASYNRSIYWIKLDAAGNLDEVATLASNVGGFPLDVVSSDATDPFPGTAWVADYGAKELLIFEPGDYEGTSNPTCTGEDSPALDEDADGFTNHDEILNGTDPCSAADQPADADGDFVSDRLDPDDDNDGTPDLSDPFALDPDDGSTTKVPAGFTWDNDAPSPGGILDLGFTGSMVNGSTDYLDTYDYANMTAGGAAGVLTVDELTSGTARGTSNDQDYGLQFGIDASPAATGPFVVETRMPVPFAGQAPQAGHRAGIQIGRGNQDDYLEFVASGANGGQVQAVLEVGGVATTVGSVDLAMPGVDNLDLFITVDPATRQVELAFEAATGGQPGARTVVGTTTVPASWTAPGLAVGIIGTSGNASAPLTSTWSHLLVSHVGAEPGTSSWQSFAQIPAPREAVALGQVGGKLYLGGGGCQGATCQGTHRRYDPATDSWQALTPIPENLTHLQSAVLGTSIYYLGGLTEPNGTEITTVYVYDTVTNTFSTATPMPAARARAAAGVVAHGGSVYVVGGMRGGHGATPAPYLDRYDPGTGTWTALADLPRPRDHFQAVVAGGKIYAVGGRNDSGGLGATVAQVDVYDIASGAWSTLPTQLPNPRGGSGSVLVGNEIIVVGGETPATNIAATDALDLTTGTWRSLAPMPVPVHGTQAAVLCGRVHVVGGSDAPMHRPTRLHQALRPTGVEAC